VDKDMQIGIIGLGAMGKLYAREFARAGHDVYGCDLPEKRSELEKQFQDMKIEILKDGIASRQDGMSKAVRKERGMLMICRW
jgi:prephenate dehydrogenase (NADP+)